MENSDPIHKATIIPRGRALGMVMNLPERDKHGYSIKYLKSRLAVCFGGRVAEELIFDFLREYNFTITPISRDLEVVKEWYCENCHKMLTSDRVHILATL